MLNYKFALSKFYKIETELMGVTILPEDYITEFEQDLHKYGWRLAHYTALLGGGLLSYNPYLRIYEAWMVNRLTQRNEKESLIFMIDEVFYMSSLTIMAVDFP